MGRGRSAVLVLAAGMLVSSPAGADVIKGDSIAGKNITAAADFIRANGRTDIADNIVDFLKRGKFYSENISESGTTAKTSSLSNITIDPTLVAPLTRPLDPDKQFALVVNLASILFHEKVHAHQSWGKFLTDSGEYDAWTQTIYEMDRWIANARGKYDRTHDKNDLGKMGDLVDAKKTEIKGFIENKCFGGNCDLWKDLLKTVEALQDAVAKEAKRIARKSNAPPVRVGMFVDETNKKEKTALTKTVPPPSANAQAAWADEKLIPPSCYASSRGKTASAKAITNALGEAMLAQKTAGAGLPRAKVQSEIDGLSQMSEIAKATPICARKRALHTDESDPLYMENYPAHVTPYSDHRTDEMDRPHRPYEGPYMPDNQDHNPPPQHDNPYDRPPDVPSWPPQDHPGMP